jgi:hypothetical protein
MELDSMKMSQHCKVFARRMIPALALIAAAQSQAAVEAQLSFVEPTANVSATAAVEVWVRLSLSPTSDPLTLHGANYPFTATFLQGLLPTTGTYYDPQLGQHVEDTFVGYNRLALNTSYTHGGNFTVGYNQAGSAYKFTFWTSSTPGKPSLNYRADFELQAGESFDYLFGVFNPVNGQAPVGTYTFYNTSLFAYVDGFGQSGQWLNADVANLGSTCANQQASCAFTRTVTAVPEPGTWLLMAVGAAGLLSRRWQQTQADRMST